MWSVSCVSLWLFRQMVLDRRSFSFESRKSSFRSRNPVCFPWRASGRASVGDSSLPPSTVRRVRSSCLLRQPMLSIIARVASRLAVGCHRSLFDFESTNWFHSVRDRMRGNETSSVEALCPFRSTDQPLPRLIAVRPACRCEDSGGVSHSATAQ